MPSSIPNITHDPLGRARPTTVRFSISPQPGAGAAYHRHNQSSPCPDLVRPPTSSKKTVWIARKAWMTRTSLVKGTWSCSRVSTNNRFLSTGQPWARPGHPRFLSVRRSSRRGRRWPEQVRPRGTNRGASVRPRSQAALPFLRAIASRSKGRGISLTGVYCSSIAAPLRPGESCRTFSFRTISD
jgi:hypothetical protein